MQENRKTVQLPFPLIVFIPHHRQINSSSSSTHHLSSGMIAAVTAFLCKFQFLAYV